MSPRSEKSPVGRSVSPLAVGGLPLAFLFTGAIRMIAERLKSEGTLYLEAAKEEPP